MTSAIPRKLSELADYLEEALDMTDELSEQLDEYDDEELYDAVGEIRRAILDYSDVLCDYGEML